MPELLTTLEAVGKKEFNNQKFNAALQGVNLDDPYVSGETTLEDIKKRVAAKNTGYSPDDAIIVKDDIGLGYEVI
jgi:hypothetical protein